MLIQSQTLALMIAENHTTSHQAALLTEWNMNSSVLYKPLVRYEIEGVFIDQIQMVSAADRDGLRSEHCRLMRGNVGGESCDQKYFSISASIFHGHRYKDGELSSFKV